MNREPRGASEAGAPTLLVVEAEADVVLALRALFANQPRKVRVLVAETAAEAETVLGRDAVDAVLVSQQLSTGDGFGVLRAVRRVKPDVPVAFMTATPDRHAVSEAVNVERVERFFAKPLDGDEVLVGMMDLLNRRRGGMRRIPPTWP